MTDQRPVATSAVNERQAGLTLVEVVVALSLLGLILVMLSGGLRFGTRVWETGERIATNIQTLHIVRNVLDRTLGAALAYARTDQSGKRLIGFSGSEKHLRFIGPSPLTVGGGIASILDIRLEKGAKGGDLVLHWREIEPSSPDPFDGAQTEQHSVLVSRVSKVAFSYFGRDGSTATPEWTTQWDDRASLPELVRVDLDFVDARMAAWPPIIIALRTDPNPNVR